MTKEHFLFDVSTFPMELIYTGEAYKQEHLIGRHKESCHIIFRCCLPWMEIWQKASDYHIN